MSNISNLPCPTGIDLLNAYVNIIAEEPHTYSDQEIEIAEKVETNLLHHSEFLTKAFTVKLNENQTSRRCQDLKEGFQNLGICQSHIIDFIAKKITYATLSSQMPSLLMNIQRSRDYLIHQKKWDIIYEHLNYPQETLESEVEILKEQASHNNYLSHYRLGALYWEGQINRLANGTLDYAQMQYYWKQAAKLGDAEAAFSLGALYDHGHIGRLEDGTPNYAKAQHYWEQAIKLGNATAAFNLGILYYDADIGRLPNGTPDYAQVKHYWEQAVNLGDAHAAFYLGRLYDNGHIGRLEDGNPNYAQAQHYWEQAVKLGNATAAFYLGKLYDDGLIGRLEDRNPNYAQAQHYWEKAVIFGNAKAAFYLGKLYDDGHVGRLQNGNPNYAQAQHYWEQALKHGDAIAAYNIGILYCDGDVGRLPSGAPDYTKAQDYLEKAVEFGWADAAFYLGELYRDGNIGRLKDGDPNYAQAMIWFRKAKKEGCNDQFNQIQNIKDPVIQRLCDYHYEFIKDDQWVTKALQSEEGIEEDLLRLIVFGTRRDDLLTKEQKREILEPLVHSMPALCSELVNFSEEDQVLLLELFRSLLSKRSFEAAKAVTHIFPESSPYRILVDSELFYFNYTAYYMEQRDSFFSQKQIGTASEQLERAADSYAFTNAYKAFKERLKSLHERINSLLSPINEITRLELYVQLRQQQDLFNSIVFRNEAFTSETLNSTRRPDELPDPASKKLKIDS